MIPLGQMKRQQLGRGPETKLVQLRYVEDFIRDFSGRTATSTRNEFIVAFRELIDTGSSPLITFSKYHSSLSKRIYSSEEEEDADEDADEDEDERPRSAMGGEGGGAAAAAPAPLPSAMLRKPLQHTFAVRSECVKAVPVGTSGQVAQVQFPRKATTLHFNGGRDHFSTQRKLNLYTLPGMGNTKFIRCTAMIQELIPGGTPQAVASEVSL
jgi:hypothetical protein